MKQSLSFPKVAGIQIHVHWTFSLLIVYIIYTNIQAGLNATQISWSVLSVLSLFLCVTLHELGHATAAKRYGIATKDITLYPIGGVARLEKMPEKPSQELVVALAGPAVNFIIILLLSPFITAEDALHYLSGKETLGANNFLAALGFANGVLAIFNLIPAFPMDGGRVLRALLAMKLGRVKATQVAAGIGKLLAFGFIMLGFYTPNPFLIFIGLFVILGANSEERMVKTQALIVNLTARNAIMTQYYTLEKTDPISKAVQLLLDGQAKSFLVVSEGLPFGILDRDALIRGLNEYEENQPVELITQQDLIYVDANTSLNDVFMDFRKTRAPLILVKENERLLGIIDTDNLAELIMVHNARQANYLKF